MNCPVCERSLAPTLSICPSCGAMMYDTVREELQDKIKPGIAQVIEAKPPISNRPAMDRSLIPARPLMQATAAQPIKRTETAGLRIPKTSPTLVGFQNKKAALPDWRIELQNAVQQRKGGVIEAARSGDTQYPVNGGTALKAEVVQRVEPALPQTISDPRVANAMRRIEESRRTFFEPEVKPKKAAPARPFGVVASNNSAAAVAPARDNIAPKPTLVPNPQIILKRNTNKLPRIEPVLEVAASVIERVEDLSSGEIKFEAPDIKRIQIKADNAVIANTVSQEPETDEIEDLAPFSMRFGAGLFDLIIGCFTAMLVLSPLAFTNGNWFTAAGGLTLAATCAIVMFLYMTICLGFFGKTMGMRLFSLELVDAVENEYPTLHQAAVNSSVYIISLAFAGAGFLTVFFNEEKRAAHDLLSGTIIVREF